MHELACNCPKCRNGSRPVFEVINFPMSQQSEDEFSEEAVFSADESEYPFNEIEETELAMELLSVSSEEEMDQFLGKLFKGAWKGLKKVGKFVGRIARPLGGILKGVAKKALPFVGGALGSFIPIPGVGTAIGSALGGALSSALEREFGELEPEDQNFEMARRFVRIAGTAARRAARNPPDMNAQSAAQAAIVAAAKQHVPQLRNLMQKNAPRKTGAQASGRWIRRGNNIVIVE